MKNLRLILTGLCGIAFVSMCLGQDLTKTGTTAAQFLKIGVGSRAIGMGGAFTATADDITAMYWNPSGLGNNYGSEALFNHVRWFADINYDYAAFATHLSGFGTVGVHNHRIKAVAIRAGLAFVRPGAEPVQARHGLRRADPAQGANGFLSQRVVLT